MPRHLPRILPTAAAALAILSLTACNDDIFHHVQDLKAQYLSLDGHSAAVVVSTPDHVLDPAVANDIGQAVARRISENVKGVKMLPYSTSRAFVEANPYWTTRPPSAVQKALGVDRLIVVDVAEFRTQEEGSNGELLQGVASGYIRVLEAENSSSERFAFSQMTTSNYPPLRTRSEGVPAGIDNASQASVRFNLIQTFSRDAAGAFYDHKEAR